MSLLFPFYPQSLRKFFSLRGNCRSLLFPFLICAAHFPFRFYFSQSSIFLVQPVPAHQPHWNNCPPILSHNQIKNPPFPFDYNSVLSNNCCSVSPQGPALFLHTTNLHRNRR